MLNRIWESLRKYDCLQVVELHALWDWHTYFKPHISQRLGGFATSQHGSGMHEFYCRKDSNGEPRLWVRRSSQASSWIPEGPGLKIFETLPTGEPPLADYKYSELDWKRSEFEGSLRQWFRYMVVKDQNEAASIRSEWDKTISALPASALASMLNCHCQCFTV